MKKKQKKQIDINQSFHENGSVTINVEVDGYFPSEIDILSPNVLFVKIEDKSIYIDYSTKQLYVDVTNLPQTT